MRIYVVRHAWAGQSGDPQFADDSLRPLTAEGSDRFSAFVRVLAKRGLEPAHVATSPFVRCLQTAEILAKRTLLRPTVSSLPALEPGSDFESVSEWTRRQAPGDVAWVGHAPDVGRLAALLIGDGRAAIDFSKGAIAAIEVERDGQRWQGVLLWLLTAKMLGC